jgi:glycosyltransferase involved in cell wall biosynthesis
MIEHETPEVSLVTESFNLAEGQSFPAFAQTIAAFAKLLGEHRAEILVTDATGDPRIAELLAKIGNARLIPVSSDFSYDAQKNLAARSARGHYVVYLDGDCRPLRPDWLDLLLHPLRCGRAEASGGTSFYDDPSPTGIAMSIIDFGYTWERPNAAMDCYAANNVAFTTSLRCEVPAVEDGMRCNCYAHTRELQRRGRAIISVVEAMVLHEMPDIERERHRRGYDVVAACWIDPLQAETAALSTDERALHWHLERFAYLDALRLQVAPAAIGITPGNLDAVRSELRRLRQMDLGGVRAALQQGEIDGRNAAARERFRPWFLAQQRGATRALPAANGHSPGRAGTKLA